MASQQGERHRNEGKMRLKEMGTEDEGEKKLKNKWRRSRGLKDAGRQS